MARLSDRRQVLLLMANESDLLLWRMILRTASWTVHSAQTADEAVAILASTPKCRMVLTDNDLAATIWRMKQYNEAQVLLIATPWMDLRLAAANAYEMQGAHLAERVLDRLLMLLPKRWTYALPPALSNEEVAA